MNLHHSHGKMYAARVDPFTVMYIQTNNNNEIINTQTTLNFFGEQDHELLAHKRENDSKEKEQKLDEEQEPDEERNMNNNNFSFQSNDDAGEDGEYEDDKDDKGVDFDGMSNDTNNIINGDDTRPISTSYLFSVLPHLTELEHNRGSFSSASTATVYSSSRRNSEVDSIGLHSSSYHCDMVATNCNAFIDDICNDGNIIEEATNTSSLRASHIRSPPLHRRFKSISEKPDSFWDLPSCDHIWSLYN
eukprot:m.103147 g.103147  ORF g.103147 m.103147 type:complete len:246 (+) comp9088_c17_seq1:697-1434(+)